jgi:hypothetical protein
MQLEGNLAEAQQSQQGESSDVVPGIDLLWSIVCASARHRSVEVAIGAAGLELSFSAIKQVYAFSPDCKCLKHVLLQPQVDDLSICRHHQPRSSARASAGGDLFSNRLWVCRR